MQLSARSRQRHASGFSFSDTSACRDFVYGLTSGLLQNVLERCPWDTRAVSRRFHDEIDDIRPDQLHDRPLTLNCEVEDEYAQHYPPLSRVIYLTSTRLVGLHGFSPRCQNDLDGLNLLARLTSLTFGLESNSCLNLAPLASLSRLRNLDLYGFTHYPCSLALAPLSALTQLQRITLPSNPPPHDLQNGLSAMQQLQSLDRIQLPEPWQHRLDWISRLVALTNLSFLQYTGLIKERPPPASLSFLCHLTAMKVIELPYRGRECVSLLDINTHDVSWAAAMPQLISLRGCSTLATAGADALQKCSNLTHLGTRSLMVLPDANALPRIGHTLHFKALMCLQVETAYVGDVRDFLNIYAVPVLENLRIGHNGDTVMAIYSLLGQPGVHGPEWMSVAQVRDAWEEVLVQCPCASSFNVIYNRCWTNKIRIGKWTVQNTSFSERP